MPPNPQPTPPTTQGTPWTDADYAAHGYGRLSLRLPTSTMDQLDALRRPHESRTQALVRLLADAHRRSQKKPKPNKSTVTPNNPLDA